MNEEIVFPEGSLLLAGDVGAGKSTILHAIEFALFGIKRGDLSGDALLRNGANQGSVELKFRLKDSEIVIKRQLKRSRDTTKQETGYIVINNKKTAGTPIELKTKVLDLLGYPSTLLTKGKDLLYRFTVYTPQDQMKQILLENSETRLETLRKVFGIDKYKLIRENLQVYLRKLKEKIKIKQFKIEDLPKLRIEYCEIKEKANDKQQEMAKLKPMLDNLKMVIRDRIKNLTNAEQAIKQLNMSKQQLSQIKGKMNELLKKRERNKDLLVSLQAEIEKINKKISDIIIKNESVNAALIESLREKISKVAQDKVRIGSCIETLERQLKTLEQEMDEIDNLNKKLDEKNRQMGEYAEALKIKRLLNEEIAVINNRINKLNLEIREHEVLKTEAIKTKERITKLDKCPTCMQPVGEEHKAQIHQIEERKINYSRTKIAEHLATLEKLQKDLTKKEKKLEELLEIEKTIERLNSEIIFINNSIRKAQEKQSQFNELKKQKANHEKQLTEIMKIDTDAEKKLIAELETDMKNLQERKYLQHLLGEKTKLKDSVTQEQDEIKEEIGKLNLDKIELTRIIELFKNSEENYRNLRKELDNLREREKELSVKAAQLGKEHESYICDLTRIEDKLKRQEELQQQINKMQILHDWLSNHFLNLMIVIERKVMANLYAEFNSFFQEWFNMLIDEENITARLDDEFAPIVIQNGYETGVSNLSGGEKTSLALAYRLSLNRVINDFVHSIKTKDLIILDEPTDGFSTEQLDKVRDVLEELSIKQVVIVSHEPKIESFVDHTIRIVKTDHVSRVIG
ncbi:hypothetical protein DRJ17_03710 [Candidatus Woesearchaeota archaeon]|nr:MAG: hypothetical protein DRJ17_03710 [Candidatus Woesearchaeota archaeon]